MFPHIPLPSPSVHTYTAVQVTGFQSPWVLGQEGCSLSSRLQPGAVSSHIGQQHRSVFLGTSRCKADYPSLNPVSIGLTAQYRAPRVSLEPGKVAEDIHPIFIVFPSLWVEPPAQGYALPFFLSVRPDKAPAPLAGRPHTASPTGLGWPAAAGVAGCRGSYMWDG